MTIRGIGKALGHATAAILVLSGLALMLLGKSMWDTGWSGGGGVPPVFILMGVFAFFSGVTLAGYAAIVWTFGTLVQLLGWKKSLGLLGIALIGGYAMSYFGLYDQFSSLFNSDDASETAATTPLFPIPAAVGALDEAAVHSTPWSRSEKTASLSGGVEVVLLEIMEEEDKGRPWFRIRYGDGVEGYMLGSSICATRKWANGLSNVCASNDLLSESEDLDADGLLLQKIELAYKLMPGRWQGLPTIYPQLEFDPDGRITEHPSREKKGMWSIETVDDSQSPTGLAIKHSVWSMKFSLTGGSAGYHSVLQPIFKLDADQIENREPRPDGSQIRIDRRALYPSDR
jgi:hypothetical protein